MDLLIALVVPWRWKIKGVTNIIDMIPRRLRQKAVIMKRLVPSISVLLTSIGSACISEYLSLYTVPCFMFHFLLIFRAYMPRPFCTTKQSTKSQGLH